MTAPDPLECLNSRAAAGIPLCGEPDSAHCEKCQACPDTCGHSSANPWTKGDRVRITYDAVYYAEPSIKHDTYALVVLPGTDLDANVLITNRFRVPLTAMSRLDDTARLDEEWLAAALDAYAKATGMADWAALTVVPEDLDEAMLGDSYRTGNEVIRDLIAAATRPLLAEIHRLTAEVENLKHSKETS